MKDYNLGFITNKDIFEHTKQTVLQYKTIIDLQEFNKNYIDPIKLTFDAKIYGKTFEQIIESECIRQIDKANTNHIGYFHQNIFKYAADGWSVLKSGFDIVNNEKKIFVEMKNKHNTMNSSSSQATYMKMLKQLSKDQQSTCLLVEVIAKQSQNKVWKVSFDGENYEDERIRRVSIDKFYEMVFGDKDAFAKLCKALPEILDDIIKQTHAGSINNTVFSQLKEISSDTFKSLYLLAFKTYEGFDNF